MSRDYKAEVLALLSHDKWLSHDAIQRRIKGATPLFNPWGHVSKAIRELHAAGLIEYGYTPFGEELWKLK